MGSRPKDLTALRALKERLVLLCDKERDEGSCDFKRNGYEDDIAVRATIVPLVVYVEIDLEVSMKLAQLSFDHVVCDQGMAATKKLAQRQASIARKQPPVFAKRALDQHLVGDGLFVCRVIAENA